jgi:hypothetical protein
MMCGGAGAMLHQINLGSRSMSVVRSTRGPLWMHPTADTDSERREKCISLAGINTRTSGRKSHYRLSMSMNKHYYNWKAAQSVYTVTSLTADSDDTSQTREELSLLTTLQQHTAAAGNSGVLQRRNWRTSNHASARWVYSITIYGTVPESSEFLYKCF